MWNNNISICGENRPCRFSINTLQKKETKSPLSTQVFKYNAKESHTVTVIFKHQAMAKPTQLSPWAYKFQIIYSHSTSSPDIAELGCMDATEFPATKEMQIQINWH